MTNEERRSEAWNYALHAEGTRVVFDARARRLRRLVRLRDFGGFAVPVLLAYILGSEAFEPLKPYRHLAVGLLGVAAVLQVLVVLWSLVTRWDEELAYAMRAGRDSHDLREAWRKIGRADVDDLELEYRLRSRQQEVIDSHDVEKSLTERERQLGMRSGLIEFDRTCVRCGAKPLAKSLPWRPQTRCPVCGGN